MLVNTNNSIVSKKSNKKAKINIDLPTLNILCRYIIQDSKYIRMEHLVNMKKLLYTIDTSTYENDPEKIERMKFLSKALEARLDNNLTDRELILNHINGGLSFKVDFLDYDNLDLSKNEIEYCHGIVEETLKYAFFYRSSDNLQDILTRFKSTDISKRGTVMAEMEREIDYLKNEFRKCHVESNLNDVTFSLDDGTFESAVTDTYNLVTNPSRRLITGMQGLNAMLGGGFESGRVYMLLGIAGVGKSLTLLNLINQIKIYNTKVIPKDRTKQPCIVLLTMENTVVETITRMFDMVVSDSHGMGNYELKEVIYKMRNEGGLAVTESSPLNIVIRYKPNRSVSTDYLYTLYDDLLDEGKEPVCVIQDHIKRIRSVDGNSELRIELGDIVNEMKVFAADKDIPLITVSHLNREATKILEEAARKGTQDNGRLVGKSNTGESLLMIDNLDCALTLAKDYDKDGLCYMSFHRIKMRDKGSKLEFMCQPFLVDNDIRLVEDLYGIPMWKESIHNVDLIPSNSRMKVSGTASLQLINDNVVEDNSFSNYELTPINASNDSSEYLDTMESFDKDLSELLIERNNLVNQQIAMKTPSLAPIQEEMLTRKIIKPFYFIPIEEFNKQQGVGL